MKNRTINQRPRLAALGTMMVVFSMVAGIIVSDANAKERSSSRRDLQAASNTEYAEECGSCHMAYPPGLLPKRSWDKLMSNLQDHFGDNAELELQVQQRIETYLAAHSADNSNSRRSKRIMRSLRDGQTPTRITELRYFKREHDEIPQRLVRYNDKVKSFSACDKCHQNAAKGNFDEHAIRIPGYGRWDD